MQLVPVDDKRYQLVLERSILRGQLKQEGTFVLRQDGRKAAFISSVGTKIAVPKVPKVGQKYL